MFSLQNMLRLGWGFRGVLVNKWLTHILVWLNRVWPGTSAQCSRDLYCHYDRATCLMMRWTWSGYRSRWEYSRRVAAINLRCSVVQCQCSKTGNGIANQHSILWLSQKCDICLLLGCTRNLWSMSHHSLAPLVCLVCLCQLSNKERNARKVFLNIWSKKCWHILKFLY